MAKKIRKLPSVSENKDFRAREAFDRDTEDFLKLVGSRTIDVPSILAGAVGSFTVPVDGARANQGQTVQIGLPSTFDTGLIPWGVVTSDNTVTVYFHNRTALAIDPPSATYSCRVMP